MPKRAYTKLLTDPRESEDSKKTGQSWWYLTIINLLNVTTLLYLDYTFQVFLCVHELKKILYGYYTS